MSDAGIVIANIIYKSYSMYQNSFDFDAAKERHKTVMYIRYDDFYTKSFDECISETVANEGETDATEHVVHSLLDSNLFQTLDWVYKALDREEIKIPLVWEPSNCKNVKL